MAVAFQPPKPGCKVQVIGGGLPRTGTNSFCAALSILLDGPAYHAGAQYGTGTTDETHILTLIDVTKNFPYQTADDKRRALAKLESLLDGYVATSDSGMSQLVPELMEIYPDAKVICTTRDRDSWAKSMMMIVEASQPRLAGFIFFWIPSVRHLPALVDSLTNIHLQRYGLIIESPETALETYDRHHRHLEEVVPKDKLVYYSVKDGWEPLCKALGKPIPDVPFPRLNDAGDVEKVFKDLAVKGLMRWAIVFAITSGFAALGYAVWTGRAAVPGLRASV
ncbi:hypothetical protein AC578_4472 [Pseudocercospora eumusae]|uniref:NAD dependent epimerase/dehydratase n=1 Tax=Pseudocercospora eumusae TaxID=321146 RepID=A0A139HBP9_9PEZI|nr:hypothetical protein AC578_4472 [Pseudocercospora eumusae]KXS99877.1 hypothetical protein AC578_4472 [Pseudocercospora eumusae]KXS99878.1 hypothetical protein AC578_4472 [Pseudocercospora eumusae]KXS99880.1 hypothetical protein AC578_4472 [Pseudocercospora eumusae]